MLSIIADYLQDTILFELAFRRKKMLLDISNLRRQIAINLLKIAVFGQESTWKHEFETLIEDIGELKLKDYKAKLSAKKYYDELFDGPFEPMEPWNESYVYNVIIGKEILKSGKYTKLYHIPLNEHNIVLIHNKIKELIKNISNLLSERFLNNDKFETLSKQYVTFWINYAEKSK